MTRLSDSHVAIAIVESSELKPTKANVLLVKEAIEEKVYLPLRSLVSLRESARNVAIPGKIDYQLLDGSVVAIDVETNILINSVIEQRGLYELVHNMVQSADNFVAITRRLIKEHNGN